MTKTFGRLCLGLAIAAITPVVGAAQGFDAQKIRVGQTVLVRDLTGAETRGVVQSADESKLVVKYGSGLLRDPTDPTKLLNDTRVFAPAEVDRVRRPGPIWDGAVKGALVALVPIGMIASYDCSDCRLGGAYVSILAMGAGIGIGIDALWGPKTVYRNRAASRRVALVPVIGKERRGFAASIRF
jgi:hypothetical protein